MRQKVVVIGHGYTSRLSIIRSVGMVGYAVDVVVIYYGTNKPKEKPIDCYSKYVNEVLYSPSGDEEALVSLLLEHYSGSSFKPVLIPESDFSVKAIDSNLERLEKTFLIPNIDHTPNALVGWMNKSKQKEQARSIGLNVASARIVTIENGEYFIPDDIHYPCFPKSIDGGKVGLGRCDNKEMLAKSLSQMAEVRDRDVLVEEYLQIDKEYALVGFSDGENVCIPAVLYNEKMSKGAHYGVAKGGRVLSVIQYKELIDKFKRLMASIHFVGIFDIDFFECQGKFYFDEINLRFGGSGYAVTKAGANLPAMFADYMTKGTYSPTEVPDSTDITFVNERICIDEWYAGNSTIKEFTDEIAHADISFIRDVQDQVPIREFEHYLSKLRRNKLIKSLIKKIKLKCI